MLRALLTLLTTPALAERAAGVGDEGEDTDVCVCWTGWDLVRAGDTLPFWPFCLCDATLILLSLWGLLGFHGTIFFFHWHPGIMGPQGVLVPSPLDDVLDDAFDDVIPFSGDDVPNDADPARVWPLEAGPAGADL